MSRVPLTMASFTHAQAGTAFYQISQFESAL